MRKLQDWFLAGYIIMLPIQFKMGSLGRYAPSDTFLLLILLGSALGVMRLRIKPNTWSLWHLGLIAAFLIATLTGLVRTGRVTQYAVLNKDIGLLVLFAAYAVMINAAYSWERIRWILRLLVLSVAIQNIFCVLGFLADRTMGAQLPFLLSDNARLNGLLVDPNAYGGLLVMAISVHIVTYFHRQSLVPGFAGALVTITLGMGILLTYSRSAWIGLFALMLLLMAQNPKAVIRLVILGIAGFYSVLQIMGPQYANEMSSLAFRQSQVTDRIELIHRAIPMFWQSPLFGIGIGVFWEKHGTIIHNTPVWILTECGVFGFVIFVGFSGWFLLRGIQAYRLVGRTEKALVIGLLASDLVMMGLSMGIEATYQRHWWLILAMIAASYRLSREKIFVRGDLQSRPRTSASGYRSNKLRC